MKVSIEIRKCENGQFTAVCPSLPGCTAHGETKAQVRRQLNEIIQSYMASMDTPAPDHLQFQEIARN